MARKAKDEVVEAVKADELPEDLQPTQEQREADPMETDLSRPISSANPPPSKRPLREQVSPVSDGDRTLQRDEREFDEDLAKSEEEVREATRSAARKTRTTDVDAGVSNSSTPTASPSGRSSTTR